MHPALLPAGQLIKLHQRYLGSDEKLSPILPHRWLAALMQYGENNNVRVLSGEVDRIWEFLAQRPADRLEAHGISFRLFLDSSRVTLRFDPRQGKPALLLPLSREAARACKLV